MSSINDLHGYSSEETSIGTDIEHSICGYDVSVDGKKTHVSQHAIGNFINKLFVRHLSRDDNGGYAFDVIADGVSRHTYLMSCDMLTQCIDNYAELLGSVDSRTADTFRHDIKKLSEGISEKYRKCKPEIDKNGGDLRLFSTDYDLVVLTFKVPRAGTSNSEVMIGNIDATGSTAIDNARNGTETIFVRPDIITFTFDMNRRGCDELSDCLSSVLHKNVDISISERCSVFERTMERFLQWLAKVRFDLTTCYRVSCLAFLFVLVHAAVNTTIPTNAMPILLLALMSSTCMSVRWIIQRYTDMPNVLQLMLRIANNADVGHGFSGWKVCMAQHFINIYRRGMAWRLGVSIVCLMGIIGLFALGTM